MNKFIPIIAAVSFLSGCQTLQNMENPWASTYSGFDRDQDGVISPQEAEESPALSKQFSRIDTNGSGGVDSQEYAAGTANIAELRFQEIDVNDDSVISEREAAAMPESLKDTFGTVDADGDKNISPQEYRAATANLLQGVDFASIDFDGDKVIDIREADEMPTLSDAFERADTDVDGLISQEEFAAAQR